MRAPLRSLREGLLCGAVALAGEQLQGFCIGDRRSGEVRVLALRPQAEGQGGGRALLQFVVQALRQAGHRRLLLGGSDNPAHRSHGFYRHLGWRPSGQRDALGHEVLVLTQDAIGA